MLALTGWLALVAAILVWSTRNSTEIADAIVVLGAAQYGGRPSPVLRARLDHALALWNAKRAPRMIFTGGRREGDRSAKRRLVGDLPCDGACRRARSCWRGPGRTSLASMHGAAVLLKTHGDSVNVPMSARPRVLLVSDPFHMLRLDVLARMHGLTPLPSPTRTSPISANRAIALEYMLRESIALPADVAIAALAARDGSQRGRGGERVSATETPHAVVNVL